MRKSLVVGNWKMHGSQARVEQLATQMLKSFAALSVQADVAVCPPYLYLPLVKQLFAGSVADIAWGAQNVCAEELDQGAFTGEVSASMLQDMACRYVIVGHSERREYYAETDAVVAQKIQRVLACDMTPILCVGENLEVREAGNALPFVAAQLSAVVEIIGVEALQRCVIAYEPIWAIGTGKTASPEQAQEVHQAIRQQISKLDATIGTSIRILYGGSVKAANAATLFVQPDIDGALVGGASLEAQQFIDICTAAG